MLEWTAPSGPLWQPRADLFREILGNPFRPVQAWVKNGDRKMPAPWLTPLVLDLARAARNSANPANHNCLDPDALLILADALEEAQAPEHIVRHFHGYEPDGLGWKKKGVACTPSCYVLNEFFGDL